MEVKIDTREKFHVITILESHLAANMTEDMENHLIPLLKNAVKNVVVKCKDIRTMDIAAAESLVRLQQTFYENNASFVLCEFNSTVEQFLDQEGLLELMNTTPTESEAWDIVQMEEIEREFDS
jgi:anti-anti-sigma factor